MDLGRIPLIVVILMHLRKARSNLVSFSISLHRLFIRKFGSDSIQNIPFLSHYKGCLWYSEMPRFVPMQTNPTMKLILT